MKGLNMFKRNRGPWGPYARRGVKPVPYGVDTDGDVGPLSDTEVMYSNGVMAIWSASDLDEAPTPTVAVDQWLERALTDDDTDGFGGQW
jgi:hypothetical protein